MNRELYRITDGVLAVATPHGPATIDLDHETRTALAGVVADALRGYHAEAALPDGTEVAAGPSGLSVVLVLDGVEVPLSVGQATVLLDRLAHD